ncbi:uncharacterized protein BXZ73DRAFT_97706 [Epithele typhae]|uniref:uncharacterized protein n=1 Tax=Epithele typhae TaxID=378194 RepID=UPI0020074949|nr:uncharacterized protein BXZ73DRAFT_97706 [Epithele typhae]KAH9942291.1 hypothetical protein BXZ73DRAFT_97706 [Epithele typhae]
MAPTRTSNRARRDHAHAQHPPQTHGATSPPDDEHGAQNELFLDPLMGTPLAIYVEKDVDNRDQLVDLIQKHGGIVSPGYSGVAYILVDPHKESGQSLYRQYAGKKGKIVLSAQWVVHCVEQGALQTYQTNFGGCKVTGTEEVRPVVHHPPPPLQEPGPSMQHVPPPPHEEMVHQVHPDQVLQQQAQAQQQQPPPPPHHAHPQPTHIHPSAVPTPSSISMAHPAPIVAHAGSFPFAVYTNPMDVAPRALQPPTSGPPQTWQAPNGIAPSQTHLAPPPPPPPPQPAAPPPQPQPEHHIIERHPGYPEEQPAWNGSYHPIQQQPPSMVPPPPPPPQEYSAYRYREDQGAAGWIPPEPNYYGQHYDQAYAEAPDQYMDDAGPSTSEANAELNAEGSEERITRGRKRTKTHPQPAPPASTLVANRRNTHVRSPTPPTRVIKSTYGGNLFTADDIEYLKRYIDYCQEQGLVLSLREICERIAIKAPHHTFYSWRRYCNKHKIRLGGYAMDFGDDGDDHAGAVPDHEPGPSEVPHDHESAGSIPAGHGPQSIAAAYRAVSNDVSTGRARSPTPPRALYRSTTGKGVAFTDEDVVFLVRFYEYRSRTQSGKLDMVTFWKDVAMKAPHHSRASWMKFYRRHKHELHHTTGDEPLPTPPDKKMRYSRQDDVLLAKFFSSKPDGTSDKIFQEFGRRHPHHPWKGWQEHHRIHKVKIDHLMGRLARGENIDDDQD